MREGGREKGMEEGNEREREAGKEGEKEGRGEREETFTIASHTASSPPFPSPSYPPMKSSF